MTCMHSLVRAAGINLPVQLAPSFWPVAAGLCFLAHICIPFIQRQQQQSRSSLSLLISRYEELDEDGQDLSNIVARLIDNQAYEKVGYES